MNLQMPFNPYNIHVTKMDFQPFVQISISARRIFPEETLRKLYNTA